MNTIIFGPVVSRRFGRSLGIDLSPALKSCNFDCLYCELPKAQRQNTIVDPLPYTTILDAVKKALAHHSDIDVLTVTANGEPTLYRDLEPLVEGLNALKKGVKLLILSNGSTITDPTIRQILTKFDYVKLSLDAATPNVYKKIDRPLQSDVEAVIEGMVTFRHMYHGLLICEILVVAGVNDKIEEAEALSRAMKRIAPDRIDIGTIDRPPAYDVKGVSLERLQQFAHHFEGLNVTLAMRRDPSDGVAYQDLSDEELLTTMARRPLNKDDLTLYTSQTTARLNELIKQGRVEIVTVGACQFYRPQAPKGMG